MRNFICLIPLVFIATLVYSQQLKGDNWSEVKQSKQGNIVVTYTEAPKFADRVNGQYDGLCFDIMKDFVAFVKKTYGVNLKVNYVSPSNPKDFDEFLANVRNGRWRYTRTS